MGNQPCTTTYTPLMKKPPHQHNCAQTRRRREPLFSPGDQLKHLPVTSAMMELKYEQGCLKSAVEAYWVPDWCGPLESDGSCHRSPKSPLQYSLSAQINAHMCLEHHQSQEPFNRLLEYTLAEVLCNPFLIVGQPSTKCKKKG
jgi:hypothetical protein